MKKLLIVLSVMLFCVASANTFGGYVELTTDALNLGSTAINYQSNDSPVEGDRPGQLVTSTAANVGSVLTIQSDGTAGSGTVANPLLVTVTARSHLDIQDNLPAGYDIHAGVITLTDKNNDLPKEGLGVRSFHLDTDDQSATYGQRLDYGEGTGYKMEGSKEVSGGVGFTDWLDYVADNPPPVSNNPPHVDEDVTFTFNDVLVAADSIQVLLTKTNPSDMYDLGLVVTAGVGGTEYSVDLGKISDASDVYLDGFSEFATGVLEIVLGIVLGLDSSAIDYFVIGARDDTADDPKGTDEHFLINGFEYDAVPEPATLSLLALGGLLIRRKK